MRAHNKKFLEEGAKARVANPNPHRETKEYKTATPEMRAKVDAAVDRQVELKRRHNEDKFNAEKNATGAK